MERTCTTYYADDRSFSGGLSYYIDSGQATIEARFVNFEIKSNSNEIQNAKTILDAPLYMNMIWLECIFVVK